MPFCLKNARTTFQRMATALLHDMMHNEVEVYVDDMIVKSKDRENHIANFRRFFERIKEYRLGVSWVDYNTLVNSLPSSLLLVSPSSNS